MCGRRLGSACGSWTEATQKMKMSGMAAEFRKNKRNANGNSENVVYC